MHLGEVDSAFKTITSTMRRFDLSPVDLSLFQLTAGCMLSALGKYEQAGQYFFETLQTGLPKFFTKSDIMFILSRSFEQLGYNQAQSNLEHAVEEGYVMVCEAFPSILSLLIFTLFHTPCVTVGVR